MPHQATYCLGIDTSCDETSVAVLNDQTGEVLANVISSQIKVHAVHGGVVPELASREHAKNINIVFQKALDEAQISTQQISSIAVTTTPGLIGCLLVGLSFAKGLAYQLQIPLYEVNHLQGHLFSGFLDQSDFGIHPTQSDFPFLGLVVSGGHTAFYKVSAPNQIELLGQTVDDAAGEAFDKGGKLIGLDYPAGPMVDKRSKLGNNQAIPFKVAKVKMGEQYLSFSGLKTAAFQYAQKNPDLNESMRNDFCASLQKSIVDALVQKTGYFLSLQNYKSVVVSGGVAMNSELRERIQSFCEEQGISCLIAKPQYCTDNAAMIAYASLLQGQSQNQLWQASAKASQKIQARQIKS